MQDTQFTQLALSVRSTAVNAFSTNEDEHSAVRTSTPRSVVITCGPTRETAAKRRIVCTTIIWTDGNSIIEDEVFPLEETAIREGLEIALNATTQLAYFDKCVLVVVTTVIVGDGMRTSDERIEVCGCALTADTACTIHEYLLPPRACGT